MKIHHQKIPGLTLIEPQVFRDHRGYFLEVYQQQKYQQQALIQENFVQDNRSSSLKSTLRGLHGQMKNPQGKLVSVVEGEVFDAVVDIRPTSPTFGQWQSFVLSSSNFHQLYVPPGLAHGFVVTSNQAVVEYKCTAFYDPSDEFTLMWNDPHLGIPWPDANPLLSQKDLKGMSFFALKEKLLK